MEKEQSLGEKMQQSQEQFRKQFNPNNPNFHGGSAEPVPTGGDRVPESMPTMYPEGYDPNQPQQEIDYGEDFKTIEKNREVYQNLKKELAKLGPIVEAFMRHDQIFKEKGDPNNQKHIKTHQENILKEKMALKGVQDLLGSFIPTLEAMDQEGKETAKELNELMVESGKKYDTKQKLGEFNFKVKKLSTKTFAIAQKNLQKMKDIKKQYAKKQNEAQQASGQKKEQTK